VQGETVWPVSTLDVADAGAPRAEVVEAPAVRLFVERARQARAGFTVHDDNVAAVSELCRRLDGIPLALELAAARVRAMPLVDIVRDLDDRFHLLTGGGRTRLPRHQTLGASLTWSHDLLSDDEQRVFRRLWVFAGGFTTDAAAAVAGFDLERHQCIDALAHLVDKSLVQLDERAGRYLMLETMREFAVDRARAAGELDEVRDRYTSWVAAFLTGLDLAMLEDPTLNAIDAEYANIRAALETANAAGSPHAVTIVDSLALYWNIAGRFADAITLADPVLRGLHPRDPHRWASIVSRLATGHIAAGNLDFVQHLDEALEIASAAGDHATVAHCLRTIASLGIADSASFEDAYETAARGGDRRNALLLAVIAPASELGTDRGTELLTRARRLADGVDMSGGHYIPDGLSALHAALRGDLATAGQMARRCLDETIRSPTIHLLLAISFIPFARQADDRELLDLITQRIPHQWRDLPGQRSWFALLDHALAPGGGSVPQEPLDTQPRNLSSWLTSDVIVRVLLSEHRDDDVVAWAEQIPDSWAWAHTAGRLARAWVAHQRGVTSTAAMLRNVIADAVHLGLNMYTTEALELAAAHTAPDHPEAAATLLGATAATRQRISLAWRYPYHEQAVTIATSRCEQALTPTVATAARARGAAQEMTATITLATAVLTDPEAIQQP